MSNRWHWELRGSMHTEEVIAVPADRRDTLIAHRKDDGSWWLDIHLQGERETVFFDL